tara:strand:- start:238 stop:1371 length:1134 start_codon:yes stop_codon:yes gene_type:complete
MGFNQKINDAMNNMSRAVTVQMMEDAPADLKYVYIGAIDEKTRPFCLEAAAQGELTKDEILALGSEYAESLVSGGGINCRHNWELASDDIQGQFHRGTQAQKIIEEKALGVLPKPTEKFKVNYIGNKKTLEKSFDNKVKEFAEGKKVLFYHGSNRKFDKFSFDKSRTNANATFQGDGIFFTSDRMVSAKYATASRNANFEYDIINELKSVNKDVGKFADAVYKNGLKAFDDKKIILLADKLEDAGIDVNDISDLVEWVAGSKSEISGGGGTVATMFSNSTVAIPDYILNIAKKLGVKNNLLEPAVYETEIFAKNVLVTSSQQKAKTAFKNGYDACIYTGSGTVDDVAEVIIYNEKNIKIKKRNTIEQVTVAKGWDGL